MSPKWSRHILADGDSAVAFLEFVFAHQEFVVAFAVWHLLDKSQTALGINPDTFPLARFLSNTALGIAMRPGRPVKVSVRVRIVKSSPLRAWLWVLITSSDLEIPRIISIMASRQYVCIPSVSVSVKVALSVIVPDAVGDPEFVVIGGAPGTSWFVRANASDVFQSRVSVARTVFRANLGTFARASSSLRTNFATIA
jgi:hypothetical protein